MLMVDILTLFTSKSDRIKTKQKKWREKNVKDESEEDD
jgi:hypothetical protein